MANKTFVEKAAEKVGYGLAMAEDVAGTVKTAIGSVADVLKKSPAKQEAKKPVKKAAVKTPAKKAARKSPAKKSPAKKAVPKKAAKKLPKKSAKKRGLFTLQKHGSGVVLGHGIPNYYAFFGLRDGADALMVLRMSCFRDAISFRIGTFFISICLLRSSIGGLPVTIIDLCTTFSTDDRCRELLERLRWPNGPECPRCLQPNPARLVNSTKLLYCKDCDYQFTVTANTIFHDSHLPLIKWLTAVYLLCESKKGMSAMQLKRMLWSPNTGSYKTAWYLCHRIRHAMASAEKVMLDGIVEMDETFVGGRQKSKRGHAGRIPYAESNKIPVVGIKQRGGELRFFKAEDVKSGTLAKFIQENISQDVEVIMTDEHRALKQSGFGKDRHQTVNHSEEVYVDGDITTNGIESAFSLLKRGIIGSWHKVSAKHLPAYLEEMTFRFNRRNSKTLFLETLQHMITADPLTFEKLTA
jgi:transposase-like protein